MRRRERRLWRARCVVWTLLCLFAAAIAFQPVQNIATRVVILAGIAFFWSGGLFLFWRWALLRMVFLAPALGIVALAALPSVTTNSDAVRAEYVRALRRYEGTPYLADGESAWGIDGAGLVRRALIDAALTEAWRQRDLSLLRSAAALWWNDASPADLGEEYQRRTYRPRAKPRLPGDLAVTGDGRRVQAFLGNGAWIEADASAKKVVIRTDAPPPASARFVRWKRFQRD